MTRRLPDSFLALAMLVGLSTAFGAMLDAQGLGVVAFGGGLAVGLGVPVFGVVRRR